MRCSLLLIGLTLSTFSFAKNFETWFKHNPEINTYSIDADNVHPAAFFKALGLSSGIEIQYDENIRTPIDFYTKDADQSKIIRFLEKEFSTLLTYKKNADNQNVLTLISILPKGRFQTSRMISAVDPIEEAIHYKENKSTSTANSVYLTRMDHLETRVRETLERQAEHTIKKREQRTNRMVDLENLRKERKQKKLAELEELKQTDPKLYAAQKAILFPAYKTKE